MTAKTPPSAKDSERQVIGSLLIDPTRIGEVADLAKSDFSDQYHATTFSVLREMHRDQVPIDVIIVMDKLDESGIFNDLYQSKLYLTDLEEHTVTSAHLEYHAGLIQEAARKRRLLEIGSEVIESAMNPTQMCLSSAAASGKGSARFRTTVRKCWNVRKE